MKACIQNSTKKYAWSSLPKIGKSGKLSDNKIKKVGARGRTKYCKIIGAAILGVSLSACSSSSAIPENTFQSLAIASLPPTKAQTNIVIGKPLPFQPEQNDSSNLLLDSHSLPVSDSVITLWGLNLNSAGNRIEVAPGAQIQAVSAYIYNCISCN